MKTLILNGSPKKNGDTEVLVQEMNQYLNGEVKIISCFNDISPCNDCRCCWSRPGCTIEDEMQEVYAYLKVCDNIVIASPIWFSSLSGPLLNLASRMQTLYAANYFRKQPYNTKQKNGVVIIVGAEKGTEIIPTQNALTIMKFMNVNRSNVFKIYSLDTNILPAEQDENALSEVRNTANMLNQLYKTNQQ